MFRLIQFILELLGRGNDAKKDAEVHNIPASEARRQWQAKVEERMHHMKVSQAALDLIRSFEGLKLSPYLDSVNIPTIGIGTTHYEDGTHVTMKDSSITEDRAYDLLRNHLIGVENCLNSAVSIDLSQNQFDALACFIYNVGEGAFTSSTMLKKLNANDVEGTSEEFERWDKAGGKVIAGLLRRRQAEKALFLLPVS